MGEVTYYEQPTKYLVKSSNYNDDFDTPVLTAGKTFILGYTDEREGIYFASESPVIIFDDFTTANKWVDFDFKVKSSAMKMITSKDEKKVLLKYIYYWLNTVPSELAEGDHKRQWISSYANKSLPIPPLEIQKEIVKILDKLTELEATLEAELSLREKQYTFYRDHLLSFGDDVEWKSLGEVAQYSSTRIKFDLINKHNYVGVDNLLQNREGKTVSNYVPTSGNLTQFTAGDILIGNIRPYLKKIWQADCEGGTNGDVLVIRIIDKNVDTRYLYQVLAGDKFFEYNMKHAKGAKMPRGNKQAILQYKIPIPPLTTQQKIVAILDKFETLTHSITEGLPKEIELRRKQYEYYREKLLTFPKQ
ncbi:restriction endonuclease subunit S [Pasteurella multocida]|uniref:restriction endonuclease subunit S n=1 Tax=Pasteurella multocida TaxID=747 RepID=UPI002C3416DA|nr:restriction endonuclease subunit S [Pasteurella multocida]MEB3484556.1 restriction endonuclease subunit S [Pasteurella multocida]